MNFSGAGLQKKDPYADKSCERGKNIMAMDTWQAKVMLRACRFLHGIKKEDLSSPKALEKIFSDHGIAVERYLEDELPIPRGFAQRKGEQGVIFLAQGEPPLAQLRVLLSSWYELMYHLDPVYQQLDVLGLAPSSGSGEGDYFAGIILDWTHRPTASDVDKPGCFPFEA